MTHTVAVKKLQELIHLLAREAAPVVTVVNVAVEGPTRTNLEIIPDAFSDAKTPIIAPTE